MEVTVTSPDNGQAEAFAGTINAEFSSRGREISGCVLSSASTEPTSVDARCYMDGETLTIELAEEGSMQNSLAFELLPNGATGYDGKVVMRGTMIPGGKVAFGDAQMTKVM